MAVEVGYPVETNFLSLCLNANDSREGFNPYPLVDISSLRLAAGLDPLATEARQDDELPRHHPLMDARQSARLLFEAIARLRAK